MVKGFLLSFLSFFIIFNCSCADKDISHQEKIITIFNNNDKLMNINNNVIETAILGAGCFWCVEAAFKNLNGVLSVKSGYTGGHVDNPTYKDVCTGETGHAEVVKLTFDPNIISYDKVLAAFFTVHDPTQLNRQGNDIGTQYRSSIFPTNESQAEKAKYYVDKLNQEQVFSKDVVTTVEPLTTFYPAEDYHDNYYENNPDNPYCQLVVKPKLEKFNKVFAKDLK